VIDISERLELLSRALGPAAIDRDGVNIAFSCPACGKNPEKKKLMLHIENEKYHCWVCDLKGRSVAKLLRKHASSYYNEWVLKFTKERRNVFLDDEVKKEEKIELPDCMSIDKLCETDNPNAKAIVRYLENRNVSVDKSYRYRLCGVIRGPLRRRVIFPSFDEDGILNYWTARSVDDSSRRYLNPKVERKNIIFNEVDINWSNELILVEGPFDFLNAGNNATPMLGSFLAKDSLLFKRIVENLTPIVLALDSDMRKKSHEIAKTLHSYGVKTRIAELGENKDVGEMTEKEFSDIVSNAQEWTPVDRLTFMIRGINSGSIL